MYLKMDGSNTVAQLKYELTDETMTKSGVTFTRIRALRDIPRFGVRAGDLGGWIAAGSNLDQDGNAWVSDNARVSRSALVSGNALVSGDAWVSGDAEVLLPSHLIVVHPLGPERITATVTRQKDAAAHIKAGCESCPSVKEFKDAVKRRRKNWAGTEAEKTAWSNQYAALVNLVEATVSLWAEAES